MLYPKEIEIKIGFDKIREYLREECISSLGLSFVEKIRMLDDPQSVKKLLQQTEEFRKILISDTAFPSSKYLNATPQLQKAKIENTFLTEEEFYELKLSLEVILRIYTFLSSKKEEYPLLYNLTCIVNLEKHLLNKIEAKIDERGQIKNNASPQLQQIRSRIQSEQSRLRKVLDNILRMAKSQGFTSEDVSLTVRGGRMVIPVNTEHKRRIKGFIHDESASGKTVFLEPAEVLEINNEIRELEYEERREVIRILTLLTDQLRPEVPHLMKAYQFLGMIDFIRAKAKFAMKIEASLPILSEEQTIELYNARHPLLLLSHQAQGKPVVPLNIILNREQRILVISGPNAGGKSVTLKTVALIQYMAQCGLLVPVDSHATIGLFKNIFIDIGDEQSIENDLSTYSSHLNNMKHFTSFADGKTLFLVDEFGTGTEPQFGGAIAEAILSELNNLKAYGVVTTHYTILKEFAENTPHVVNAAMRFDLEHLEPLYQLEIGKPGSSFALEIAGKIGLSGKIIQKAKENIGVEQVTLDKLLQELEQEKKNYADNFQQINKQKAALQKSIDEYSELKSYIDQNKRKLLNEAREEAQRLLNEANQQIETTIREIKEQRAEKESTKAVRNKLEQFKQSIKPKRTKEGKEAEIKVVKGEINSGDMVRLRGQDAIGEVISIKGKSAEVNIGSLKSHIKLSRLEKVSKKESRQIQKETYNTASVKGFDFTQRQMDFSGTLDVRGKRTEEALPLVDSFLDNAILLGYQELRIVHGKGDGILRQMIRAHLKSYQMVKTMQDEHADRGGAGMTILTLK